MSNGNEHCVYYTIPMFEKNVGQGFYLRLQAHTDGVEHRQEHGHHGVNLQVDDVGHEGVTVEVGAEDELQRLEHSVGECHLAEPGGLAETFGALGQEAGEGPGEEGWGVRRVVAQPRDQTLHLGHVFRIAPDFVAWN